MRRHRTAAACASLLAVAFAPGCTELDSGQDRPGMRDGGGFDGGGSDGGGFDGGGFDGGGSDGGGFDSGGFDAGPTDGGADDADDPSCVPSCGPNEVCSGGVCECRSGFDDCSGECVELTSENCGDGVDNDCNGSTDCDDVACAGAEGCPCGSDADCDDACCFGEDVCRDLSTDPDNCGSCGISCSAGRVCVDGTCCDSTETDCADFMDNDCDGLTDGEDPDCP